MKRFYLIIVSLFVMMFFSCKSKNTYNKEAYTEIMDNSVILFAKEEKGKVQPAGIVRFSDTLSLNSSLKAVVESVNKVKDKQIEKTDY